MRLNSYTGTKESLLDTDNKANSDSKHTGAFMASTLDEQF